MPTLDLTAEAVQDLLELADKADNLTMLTVPERRRLHDLGVLLRNVLLGASL